MLPKFVFGAFIICCEDSERKAMMVVWTEIVCFFVLLRENRTRSIVCGYFQFRDEYRTGDTRWTSEEGMLSTDCLLLTLEVMNLMKSRMIRGYHMKTICLKVVFLTTL